MKSKNAIVGYTGLVGSNLLQFYNFDYYYNSKNFAEAKHKSFDTLFFCGIPAVKWYANKNPEEDRNTIDEIQSILDTVSAKKIVLISTIDVYENIRHQGNEDSVINPHENHTYGKNRFLFEEYVKSRFNDYHIIRLPALFGKGLKKNIIYDLIHNNNVQDIPINSAFQWYYLEWLKQDIDTIIHNDIKVCNLFTEPILTKKIVQIFSEIYCLDYSLNDNSNFLEYNLCTKYNNIFNSEIPYVKNNADVIAALYDYFQFEKKDKSKLCVSNICVNKTSQLQFASILKLFGISNVQIAPTKIIDSWKDLNELDLSLYTNMNLKVYAFQSITYTLNHLNIFDTETADELYTHLTKIIDCAEENDIKVLVFGCPQNRRIQDFGADNDSTFVNFFQRIGKYLVGKKVVICLENNSKNYNCNYINTIEECSNLVRAINSDNIKMMVDLGNAVMENDKWDDLENDMPIIYNIDVSNPYMTNFVDTHESHKKFNNILKDCKYSNIFNLEFLIKDENELRILRSSLTNFINTYAHAYN